jgi:hypothetical protein
LKDVLPAEKGFRQQSDAVAVTTRLIIAKIRKHILEDHCKCCALALNDIINDN